MKKLVDPKNLDVNKIEMGGYTSHEVKVPFELKPKDFLDFASEDLKGRTPRDSINAIGNIKRSIDCLFDSLLFAVNFFEESKQERWNFPEKMKFLGEIGIITPYILQRINSVRNLLEHEFRIPKRKDVETAYDVAVLLYYASVGFITCFVDSVELKTSDQEWNMELNRLDRKLTIYYGEQEFFITWADNPEDYKRWLSIVLQARYLRR